MALERMNGWWKLIGVQLPRGLHKVDSFPKTCVNKLYWLALEVPCEEPDSNVGEAWLCFPSYTSLRLSGSEGDHSAFFFAVQLAFWHLK